MADNHKRRGEEEIYIGSIWGRKVELFTQDGKPSILSFAKKSQCESEKGFAALLFKA